MLLLCNMLTWLLVIQNKFGHIKLYIKSGCLQSTLLFMPNINTVCSLLSSNSWCQHDNKVFADLLTLMLLAGINVFFMRKQKSTFLLIFLIYFFPNISLYNSMCQNYHLAFGKEFSKIKVHYRSQSLYFNQALHYNLTSLALTLITKKCNVMWQVLPPTDCYAN